MQAGGAGLRRAPLCSGVAEDVVGKEETRREPWGRGGTAGGWGKARGKKPGRRRHSRELGEEVGAQRGARRPRETGTPGGAPGAAAGRSCRLFPVSVPRCNLTVSPGPCLASRSPRPGSALASHPGAGPAQTRRAARRAVPYLRLQILGVVVGGVLGVHLLFPHFAHEAGNVACSAGMGGHFGGLQPPLRLSLPPVSSSPAAAAAPRPSPDLPPPPPKSHSGAASAGAGLSLSPREFLPSPRPAGAEQRQRAGWRSGGAGSARGRRGGGGARRRGRAVGGREGEREGRREGGEKEGERGQGAVLSPARRPPSEPQLRPGSGAAHAGQRGALRRRTASGAARVRVSFGAGKSCGARQGAERGVSTFRRRRAAVVASAPGLV